jgi:hypothetical protein
VYNTVFNAKTPIVLVKDLYLRKDMKPNYFNFLVLVDGSKKAIQGLQMAFKLKNPEDKIHVFYIPESKEQQNTVKI